METRLEDIHNSFNQAYNIWKTKSAQHLENIKFENIGTNNKKDQLGDLIAQVSISMQEINRKIRLFKYDKEKLKNQTAPKYDYKELF